MKKRVALLLTAIVTCLGATAQSQMRLWQGSESTRINLSDAQVMTYSNGGTAITIAGTTYNLADIDSLTIVHQVVVTFSEGTATAAIPAAVADDVTFEADGAYATITNNNVSNEIEFILSGESSNGSFTYNGTYKTTFRLNGLTLTSQRGAAIDIRCGKRIDLVIEDGTTNSLTDCANGLQKAAFNCQGHLEVSGGGTLNIAGNTNHAFRSNEYLLLKKSVGTINVTKAVADGIHCSEYFQMNGGTLNISGYGSDGLQMEMEADSEEPDNGIFTMNGGTIKVTHTAAGSKAVRADSTEAVMNINGGTIEIDLAASASDAKGLVCDGNINISESQAATAITINVAGNGYVDDADEKIRTTGMKSDATITIDGGTIDIYATGRYSRGMRAVKLIANGGVTTVKNTGSSSQGIKLDNTFVSTGGTVNANFKY